MMPALGWRPRGCNFALALTLLVSGVARAEDLDLSAPDDGVMRGPLLPETWNVEPKSHWVVGVTLENAVHRVDTDDVIQQTFLGLSVGFRAAWANPHLRLLLGDQGVNARAFAGLGFRAFIVDLWGAELSYGVGAHFDARLARHYWLVGVTPIELGATLYDRGSWSIQLFAGARVAVAGRLLDSFLIDPNGINNAAAMDDLRDARDDRPWEGFVSLVFGRKVE